MIIGMIIGRLLVSFQTKSPRASFTSFLILPQSVTGVINELMRKGADVIFEDVHVSGHACKEDIKLIYSLVNPLYAIPVHHLL